LRPPAIKDPDADRWGRSSQWPPKPQATCATFSSRRSLPPPGEQADTDERIELLERTILYAISEVISLAPGAATTVGPRKY
jgi:hypothetical protein